MTKYSIWLGAKKAIIGVALVVIPVAIDLAPKVIEDYSTYFNLTIGGVLIMALNYIKFYLNNRKKAK